MKKFSALLLAIVFCLGLCACGGQTPPADNPGPEQAPPVTDGAPSEPALAPISEETISDTITAEDGTALASYQYTYPVMVEDHDGAQVFNAAMEVWLADELEDWRETIDEAGELLDAMPDATWDPDRYVNEITYTPTQTGNLLSIVYTIYTYTAGAHGNTEYEAWLFDLAHGQFVDWSELFVDEEQIESAVAAEILAQIDAKELAAGYFEDYADTVADWDDETVFFNGDGSMTVLFASYSLAPYAAGEQSFVIAPEVFQPYLTESAAALLGL